MMDLLSHDARPLFTRGTERRYAAHQDLFLQDASADEIVGIVSGRVKLWRSGEDGTPCTLLLLGAGEMLGSVAVAQGTNHLTSATAIDAVVARCWPAALFRAAVRSDGDLADQFLRAVARRAEQLLDRFGDTAGAPVEVRLARLLIRLSGEYGRHDDDLAVVISLRQEDLADMAFTTVPTVSRCLSGWRHNGLIETRRGSIVVPHLSRLALRVGLHLD